MPQTTMISQMRVSENLDGFEILEHKQDDNVSIVICSFCETKQERPFSSIYQFYLGQRDRIPCSNKVCNRYRRDYKSLMSYDQFMKLVAHGCRLCGEEVARPRELCGRCRSIVHKLGGEPNVAKFIRQAMKHTGDFTIMWEADEPQGNE